MLLLFILLQDSASSTAFPNNPDIVVTGKSVSSIVNMSDAPLVTLSAADIRAFGSDTIADLLKAVEGITKSGRVGVEQPILLMNGKKISGSSELQSLPAEAILRVEILSEHQVVRYGFSAFQRVINIITLRTYKSTKVNVVRGTTTDTGGNQAITEITLTRITDLQRLNIALSYSEKDPIRENQRGIVSTAGLYDPIGNVTGVADGSIDPALDLLVGQPVIVAGVPTMQPTLAGFAGLAGGRGPAAIGTTRTLQPMTRQFGLNAVAADRVFGSISASVNVSSGVIWSRALQGPVPSILTVSHSNPFSPFTSDVLLYKYIGEVAPLSQASKTARFHASASLNGSFGRLNWSVTGGYDWSDTRTSNERGIDVSAIQNRINVKDTTVNPFAPLPIEKLGMRLVDTGHSEISTGAAMVVVSGSPFRLAAGEALVSMTLLGEASRLEATSVQSGKAQSVVLPRDAGRVQINADLPVASGSQNVLAALGNVSANFQLSVSHMTRFRTISSFGYGINWTPIRPIRFNISIDKEQVLPSAAQLASPTIATPNVTTFDYIRGVTSLTTLTNGGNPGLTAETHRTFDIRLSLQPFASQPLFINVDYIASRNRNLVSDLPTATAAIEAAFPERFMRAADRSLISINARPVNLAHENRQEIDTVIFYSRPTHRIKSPPPAANSDRNSATDMASPGRMTIILTHIWRLRDVVTLRSGLPQLDLLGGDVLGGAGGPPRHEVKLDIGRDTHGIGVRLATSWQSATRAVAFEPTNTLRFSSLVKMDAKVFLELDQFPGLYNHAWARQLRFTLAIDNLLNRRLNVIDGLGEIPVSYQPAYLDPMGRFVSLSLRKSF